MNRRTRSVDLKTTTTIDCGRALEKPDLYEMKLKEMPRNLIKRFRKLRDLGMTSEGKFNKFVSHIIDDELRRLEKLERERNI